MNLARLLRVFRPHKPKHSVEDVLDRLWAGYIHDRAVYRRTVWGWA